MSATRIYVVQDGDSTETRLIEATSQSAAIRHAVQERFSATIGKPKTIADLMETGVKVERASAE